MPLTLSPDELLSTTRSVRRHLDLERPVELGLIRECLSLALQAPSGGNAQGWHFVVVTQPATKQALGALYQQAWRIYTQLPRNQSERLPADPAARAAMLRVRASADYLSEHLREVPVIVIPCVKGRLEHVSTHPVFVQASLYGSILPAAWSFMLAARSRGLASCWSTVHLMFEAEAAQVLGIPYDSVTQTALIPVAYAKGMPFKPAARKPLEEVLHMEAW